MKKMLIRPSLDEIQQEIDRRRYWKRYRRAFRNTAYALAVVAALTVLVSTLWMPVLQITGSSMEPALRAEELVLTVRTPHIRPGDIIAFYYNNKILVKRVIADQGQYVDIWEDGTVLVDGVALEEPYVRTKDRGECDISLPSQVGDGQFFVMGDDRTSSLDSRIGAIGTVSKEQILGKVLFRIWPISAAGKVR